ncbi:hypothetical protein L249_7396, partial [Ophiocordyceps polyrhachis-furcata BCC 54312]
MLTRRLIVLLKKARLACLVLKRLPDLPYVPSLPCPAVTYSLCDVRRPRAGYSRPGVTVSGAPAKLVRA